MNVFLSVTFVKPLEIVHRASLALHLPPYILQTQDSKPWMWNNYFKFVIHEAEFRENTEYV